MNLPVMHTIPDDTKALTRAANRGELVRERNGMRGITRRFNKLAQALL